MVEESWEIRLREIQGISEKGMGLSKQDGGLKRGWRFSAENMGDGTERAGVNLRARVVVKKR